MAGLYSKYFVLKPRGNDLYAAASRRAMLEYADVIWQENPELAEGLREWVSREHAAACPMEMPGGRGER